MNIGEELADRLDVAQACPEQGRRVVVALPRRNDLGGAAGVQLVHDERAEEAAAAGDPFVPPELVAVGTIIAHRCSTSTLWAAFPFTPIRKP